MKLVYDPNLNSRFGLYKCPQCGELSYGGDDAVHKENCSVIGYKGFDTIVFGPPQVERVLELVARKNDEDYNYCGLTLRILKDQFPELLSH